MQENCFERDWNVGCRRESRMVGCEQCAVGIQRQVSICSFCLFVLCGSCSLKHQCQQSSGVERESSDKKIQKLILLRTQREGYQLVPQECTESFRFDALVHKPVRVTCERCLFKFAVKCCVRCTIKYLCLSCFKLLHSCGKTAQHESVDINVMDFQEKKPITANIKSAFQSRKNQDGKSIELNLNNIALPKDEREENGKRAMEYKSKFIQKNLILVNSLKGTIEEECKSLQNGSFELMESVKKEIESIIEQIKLKLMQFDLKVRQQTRKGLQQYRILLKNVQKKELIYTQLLLLLENKQFNLGSWQKKIQDKANKQFAALNAISKDFETLKEKNGGQKVSDYFCEETILIKEAIKKMQFRRILTIKELSSSTITISMKTPKKTGKSMCDGKKKTELKNGKTANLSFCRSMDKFDALSIGLNSPLSLSILNQSNIISNSSADNNILNQTSERASFTTPSDESNIRESNNLQSLYAKGRKINFDKKEGRNAKQFRSKGNFQKSSTPKHLLIKSNLSGGKSGVTKAFANIQKTKKLITSMRSQINQFNSRLVQEAQVRSLVDNAQGGQRGEEQEQCLDLSHISIESMIGRQERG